MDENNIIEEKNDNNNKFDNINFDEEANDNLLLDKKENNEINEIKPKEEANKHLLNHNDDNTKAIKEEIIINNINNENLNKIITDYI